MLRYKHIVMLPFKHSDSVSVRATFRIEHAFCSNFYYSTFKMSLSLIQKEAKTFMLIVVSCIGSCWTNRKEGDHWEDLGIDGWIILGWISRRWDVGIWTGLGWPRIGTGGGRL